MILPHKNRRLAQQYFDTLPENDVNRTYYDNGVQYTPTKFSLFKMYGSFNVPAKIQYLKNFYPHHRTVLATEFEYDQFMLHFS